MNDNLTKNVEFNEQQVTQLQTNISEEEFNFLNRVLSKYRIADEHISELTDEHINGVVDKIKERVSEMKKKMELNPESQDSLDILDMKLILHLLLLILNTMFLVVP